MKICILSLYKSENLGEMAYTECVRKLIQKKLPEAEIELVDIHGRDANKPYKDSLLVRLFRKLHMTSLEKKYYFASRDAFLLNYYSERVKNASAVVVPGGGYIKCTPKSKRDRFYRYNTYFSIMADVCERENIGFFFNAVGHTINRNEENELSAWKKTFSKPAIRYVSCRDELRFFKAVREDSQLVCCTAAYAAELFGVNGRTEKKDPGSVKKIIGIGVIREDAFNDYGFSVTGDKLLLFYQNLIHSLSDRGYEVKLFTNGLKRDQLFGERVAESLGRKDILLPRPEKIEDLLNMISEFQGLIVSRMHAAIIGYSFDIPAVCLCWNNKHREFLSCAGVPERAIYPDKFDAEYVTGVLDKSMSEGWPKEQREKYRLTALKSVDMIIENILPHEEEQ